MNKGFRGAVPMIKVTIEANGARLVAQSFGEKQNPAILLIMGATASMDWWDEDFCRSLASRSFFVIRYDNRDTGESTVCPPGQRNYDVGHLVDDVVAILDHYDLKSSVLFGISLGGMIAQLVAIKYEPRVDALVLLSSSIWDETPDLPQMSDKVLEFHSSAETLDWSNELAVAEYLVGGWEILRGSRYAFEHQRFMRLAKAEQSRATNLLSRFNHSTLTGCENLYGRSTQIGKPTLVIHGDEDPIFPWPHAERLVSLIQGAQLLRLEGVGHEFPSGVWSTVIHQIEEFLTQEK